MSDAASRNEEREGMCPPGWHRIVCDQLQIDALKETNAKLLTALEHAERALSNHEEAHRVGLANERVLREQRDQLERERDRLWRDLAETELVVATLRTRLAEAESERDHASMQAGINADLVHKAEERGRAYREALEKYADQANYESERDMPSAIDMDDGACARAALSPSTNDT